MPVVPVFPCGGGGPCPPCPPATMGWVTVADYPLTGIDSAAAVTTTGGNLALTVGGAPYLTLTGIAGSGTGSLTPTNGSGVVFAASGGGNRTVRWDIDWAALGIDLYLDPIVIQHEFAFVSSATGGDILAMMHTSGSGLSANFNTGVRWTYTGAAYQIATRYFNGSAIVDTNWSSSATPFSGNYSASIALVPSGIEARGHVGSLVLPPAMGLGPRRWAQSAVWGSTLPYPAGPPRAAFGVADASAAWRRIRVLRRGAV